MCSASIMRITVAALLLSVPVTTHAQNSEQTTFELAGDQAVVEWISPSTFRFCRAFSGQSCLTTEVHGATHVEGYAVGERFADRLRDRVLENGDRQAGSPVASAQGRWGAADGGDGSHRAQRPGN